MRFGLVVTLVLVVAAYAYTRNFHSFLVTEDEGQYLYSAWRISLGELPYRNFLTAQMPLFLFWGGLLQRVFGHQWIIARSFSLLAVLASALVLMGMARRPYGLITAVLAGIIFLANDSVFEVGRVFRSDPYMLWWTVAALALMVKAGDQRPETGSRKAEARRRFWIATAGLCYALGTLYKLFGAMALGGACLYLLVAAWPRHAWRQAALDLLALLAPYAATTALGAAFGLALSPAFPYDVIGHHLRQGADRPFLEVLGRGMGFYWRFVSHQPLLLALCLPGLWRMARQRRPADLALLCQLPTLLVFLFISRDLAQRYLIYLMPVWAIAVGNLISEVGGRRAETGEQKPEDGGRRSEVGDQKLEIGSQKPEDGDRTPRRRHLCGVVQSWRTEGRRQKMLIGLAALAIALALWPYLERDLYWIGKHQDHDLPVVARIEATTQPDDVVVADHQWINFLAGRRTTYSAAALSVGATESGQITGARLWQEIAAASAPMIVVDMAEANLARLRDYDTFYRQIQDHFALNDVVTDANRILEIYQRRDELTPGPDTTFGGWLRLPGVRLPAQAPAGGDEVALALRWQRLEAGATPDLSFSLRLRDGNGLLWAQVDGPIRASRSREGAGGRPYDVSAPVAQWQAGQIVLTPARLPLPADMPEGEYHLWLRVYESQTLQPVIARAASGAQSQEAMVARLVARTGQLAVNPAQMGMAAALNLPSDGVTLLGRGPLPETARPGDRVTLALWWRADRDLDAPRLRLSLGDGRAAAIETSLAGWEGGGGRLRAGQVMRGHYALTIAPEMTAGAYPLTIAVAGAPAYTLGTIAIAGRARSFDLPPLAVQLPPNDFGGLARLAGYDLDQSALGQGQIAITLTWQAQATATLRYKVFVQALDGAGKVALQSDAEPDQGNAPTTGWLPSEVIRDHHVLAAQGPLTGPLQIIVGFYDPESGQRLPVTGEGGQSMGDSLTLAVIAAGAP
jgi:4-amino-4-deoxy-L-arabinose transferase-like glycosyltransferase